MDEYEQTQRLRELWSRAIMIWSQVMLPVAAGFIAVFVKFSYDFSDEVQRFSTGLLVWFLFFLCMLYWRLVVNHIDDQIVGLYPSMLRLDRRSGWETQTRYYYTNLTDRSLLHLNERLHLEQRERLTRDDYDRYKEVANRRGLDHYELLLKVWQRTGVNGVTSRGHSIQDAIIFLLVTSFLVAVLSFKFNLLCSVLLSGLFFLAVMLFWSWCRRRWPFGQHFARIRRENQHNTDHLLQRYVRLQVLGFFFMGVFSVVALLIIVSKYIPALSANEDCKLTLTFLSWLFLGLISAAAISWAITLAVFTSTDRLFARLQNAHPKIMDFIQGDNEFLHYLAWTGGAVISLAALVPLMITVGIIPQLIVVTVISGSILIIFLGLQMVRSFPRHNR